MKPPFIVYEHGDMMFFQNLDVLDKALEPIDVLNGECEFGDADQI